MAQLIRIGNSQGLRIPKPLIEQGMLEGKELSIEVLEGGGLIIRPLSKARSGWAEQIQITLLEPTPGRESNKTRPCVIVSPDEMSALATVIVAPMTTKGFDFPCRVRCTFQNKQGFVRLDQMRAVDKSRLTQKLGNLPKDAQEKVCDCLQEMFKL